MSIQIEPGGKSRWKSVMDGFCSAITIQNVAPAEAVELVPFLFPRLALEECKAMGMSRDESISYMRSKFVNIFQDEDDYELFLAKYEGKVRLRVETQLCGIFDSAIKDVFGEEPDAKPSDIVRLLTKTTLAKPDQQFQCNIAPENFGPIVIYRRVGGPNLQIPRLRAVPNRFHQFSYASLRDSGFQPFDVESHNILRIRRIQPRLAKTKYGLDGEYPYAAEITHGWLRKGGLLRSGEACLVSRTGAPGTWGNGKNALHGYDEAISVAISMASIMPKVWHTDISLGGITVRMFIDPGEAKHLFKLREIEDGQKRREALVHYVRSHQRARKLTPNEVSEVRKHLRGKETCKWDGCSVAIHAPPVGEELQR